MGLETEYGILGAASEEVVSACLEVARGEGRAEGVRWDYSGEYPLRDARGFEVDRSAVDPSLLTDTGASVEGPVPGRTRTSAVVRLTAQEEAWQRGTATCLPDGGRLYVDHGHPEYATPECTGPAQAVLADRAGELLLTRAAALLRARGTQARLFKNNIDGKGATYGTHENYLVPRAIAFEDLVAALVPYLVVRPLLVGAGRVGTGVISEGAEFQICQRADYIERVVGLGTTVDRPLVNTRDEPHADPARWRRLHVIVGDANTFETITWLKLGMTSLVLQALADGLPEAWRALELADPVASARAVSRDTGLAATLELADGGRISPLEVLEAYLDQVRTHLERRALPVPRPAGDPLSPDLGALADGLDAQGRETGALLAFWEASLTALRARRDGDAGAAGHLEWVAKEQLITATAERHPGRQGHAVLHAVDLSWSELGRALAELVPAGARARAHLGAERIAAAMGEPPATTRAWLRGRLVGSFETQVVAAGWHSMVLETGERHHRRLPLTDPLAFTRAQVGPALEGARDIRQVLAALTGEPGPASDPGTPGAPDRPDHPAHEPAGTAPPQESTHE
ncbi:proteasome accessory factor PafA2 family protein [Actinomyces bowdenii]|uniref:Proteasome accessory factor PafA2 family protein n=2 Tax=Actinomyces bowdenii TaxID=131109 RepID=A0A853EHR3_9ACTO|nr:proteasome accessory factor PafA2 family protein [Actinomyces bowdenii]MBF0696052.1 proteasome accessory factor PafA2 family protein [Actinomyces bowdenii]NYS68225.1 proteasome accessory factor PafA2 family protein [Actinomyces bowdenii]